jgi:hypothetical protein
MSTYGSSKANVLAVVAEVTAGTPVEPSAGTDYLTLQPDFSLTPNFESLQNDEIRASIGMAKPIQGLEQPEGTLSHYLKHSGVEGQAPEYNLLLKSLFGTESVNGTERTLAASSTVSLLKLAAGGSDFARGKAVLVKDGTNGYAIRPVQSMATNDMTLGFSLANAPAVGVNIGKCVNYSPANEGHPSLTFHSFRGNGQLKEVLAGAQVQEMSLQATAGQLINLNFSFQGTKYFFNPIRLTAQKFVDFEDDGGDHSASLPAGIYRDPHEFAQALEDAMNDVADDVITVEYLDNDATNPGKFRITSDGAVFELKWQSGANTANTIGTLMGFTVSADDTGALFYVSDTAQSWVAPHTPSYDSADPIAAKYLEVMVGEADDFACFCVQELGITVGNTVNNVPCICAESGVEMKKTTGREVRVTLRALIDKHDADKFRRYRANTETRFNFNFGVREGGNWVAGKCGNVYIPTAVISRFVPTDLDTMIGVEMELTGFIDSNGNGEVYLNFL